MRELLLLRHGEAASSSPDGRDETRPLSSAGRRDVDAVAQWLEREAARPDLALCSSAVRTRETLEIVSRRFPGLGGTIVDGLYLASLSELVAALGRADPAASRVLLVGHNPGLSALVAWLDPDVRPPVAMAPAGLAVLTLRVDGWADLAPGAAELRQRL